MTNEFKDKYLKYKKKYLELKGGAHCPRLGFHQYTGQCWNDAFQMIILYSNELSEPIQHFFNNPEFKIPKRSEDGEIIKGEFEFNKEHLGWLTYINNYEMNKDLLPLNIEFEDFKQFIEQGIIYIENLFNRYHNDIKPSTKDSHGYDDKSSKVNSVVYDFEYKTFMSKPHLVENKLSENIITINKNVDKDIESLTLNDINYKLNDIIINKKTGKKYKIIQFTETKLKLKDMNGKNYIENIIFVKIKSIEPDFEDDKIEVTELKKYIRDTSPPMPDPPPLPDNLLTKLTKSLFSTSKPSKLLRRNSMSESYSCVIANYVIYNMNILKKKRIKDVNTPDNGGDASNIIINIGIINYFINGYVNLHKLLKIPINFIINYDIYDFKNIYCDKTELIKIIENLDNDKYKGVIISIASNIDDDFDHVQSFINCNDTNKISKYYYYDNTGSVNIYKNQTLIEFKWKEFLKQKIEYILKQEKEHFTRDDFQEYFKVSLDKIMTNFTNQEAYINPYTGEKATFADLDEYVINELIFVYNDDKLNNNNVYEHFIQYNNNKVKNYYLRLIEETNGYYLENIFYYIIDYDNEELLDFIIKNINIEKYHEILTILNKFIIQGYHFNSNKIKFRKKITKEKIMEVIKNLSTTVLS